MNPVEQIGRLLMLIWKCWLEAWGQPFLTCQLAIHQSSPAGENPLGLLLIIQQKFPTGVYYIVTLSWRILILDVSSY